jgi:hypothetical protein
MPMSRVLRIALVSILLVAARTPAAESWGNVTMRFVLDGDAKPPMPRKIDRDKKVCGEEVIDESLLVNPKDRGIANVIVWLVPQKGEDVPVHPDYEKSREAEVVLRVKGCRYQPHVVLLRTTQTLVWKSADPIGHNPKVELLRNPPNSNVIPSGGFFRQQFVNAESEPAKIECTIHPWMSGHILVRDNPYMAVSDASGNLKLANVPAGKRTFYYWHERRGVLSDLTIGKVGKTRRGQLALDVDEGQTNLGEIRIPASSLEL